MELHRGNALYIKGTKQLFNLLMTEVKEKGSLTPDQISDIESCYQMFDACSKAPSKWVGNLEQALSVSTNITKFSSIDHYPTMVKLRDEHDLFKWKNGIYEVSLKKHVEPTLSVLPADENKVVYKFPIFIDDKLGFIIPILNGTICGYPMEGYDVVCYIPKECDILEVKYIERSYNIVDIEAYMSTDIYKKVQFYEDRYLPTKKGFTSLYRVI